MPADLISAAVKRVGLQDSASNWARAIVYGAKGVKDIAKDAA